MLGVGVINAQVFLGKVLDQEGLTLPSAQIALKVGAKIKSFAITDAQGEFSLSVPQELTDSTTLEVRYFGYASFLLRGNEITGEALQQIVLRDAAVELREVIVSAAIIPSMERGDTVVFNTAAYRDGSEKKIDAVIAKLPGVEVDDNGRIKVQGKPLDRILINGEDVFDSNYKLLSQNVPADFVNQIEVLSNYQADELVGDLEGSGTTTLNLKLDPSKKGLAFGEINGELGNNRHQFAQSNLFYLDQSVKAINFSDFSTLGNASTAAGDLLASSQGIAGLPKSENFGLLQNPASRINGLLSANHFLRNETFGTAQSIIFNLGDHANNRLVANVYKDRFGFQEQRIRENFSPGQIDTFQQIDEHRFRKMRLWLQNDFKTSITESSRIDVRLSLSAESGNADTKTILTQSSSAEESTPTSSLAQSPYSALLSVRYLNRLNSSMALSVTGSWRDQHHNQFQLYTGDIYQGIFPQNSFTSLGQSFTKQATQAGGEISLMQQVKSNKFRYVIGSRINSGVINTLLKSSAEQSLQNPDITEIGVSEEYLKTAWSGQWEKLRVNSSVQLSRFGFSGSAVQETHDVEIAAQGDLSLSYQVNVRNQVTLWANTQRTTPLAEQIIQTPYLASGVSLSSGLDSLYLIREHSYGINYNYRNQFHQYGYGIRVFKSVTPNGISNELVLDNFFTINQLLANSRNSFFSAAGNFDYYFTKAKTHLKITSRFSQVGTPLDFGNGAVMVNTRSYDFGLKANTQFSRTIKYGAYTSYRVFSNSIGGQVAVQSQLFVGNKIVISPRKGTRGVIKYDVYIPNLNSKAATLHLVSTEFTHELKGSPVELGIGGTNLLNVGQVEEVRLSTYQRVQRSYRLLPRTLYLMVKYGF